MVRKSLWLAAFKDVRGSPGLSLAIVFASFGAYLKSAGLDIFQSIAMNMMVYAVPGQLVALNSILSDLSIVATVLLVLVINIRLLPMSFSMSHLLKKGKHSLPMYYFSAYFVAVTGWMNFITNYRNFNTDDFFDYFVYSSCILWLYAMSAFLLGYYLISYLSYELFVALLLVNPLYFLMVVAHQARDDLRLAISVTGGGIFYLLLSSFVGNFALPLAGFLGGTLAFVFYYYTKKSRRK